MEDLKKMTFKQFVLCCEAVKKEYKLSLSPFFNAKKVKLWRDTVYSLSFEKWKKDRLWEFLNGDIPRETLLNIIFGGKNGKGNS